MVWNLVNFYESFYMTMARLVDVNKTIELKRPQLYLHNVHIIYLIRNVTFLQQLLKVAYFQADNKCSHKPAKFTTHVTINIERGARPV